MNLISGNNMVKVLGICGSLRKSSVNMAALQFLKDKAHTVDVDLEIADLSGIPFLNPDAEDEKPEALEKLLEQMVAADAFVLASPEYNYSFTPALKNALDWGSRLPGNAGFQGKAASIIGVGGGLRASRSQYAIRQVGVFLDLHFVNKPEVMLSAFDGTFDKEGNLVSDFAKDLLVQQLTALKDLSLSVRPPSVVAPEL